MLRSSSVSAAALAAALVMGVGTRPAVAVTPPTALSAQVVDISRPEAVKGYRTIDYTKGGARTGTTSWRIVQGTGNCCENYLAATPQGRLLDFGGSYVNYSDDRGVTWHSVRPLEPLVNGEGTIDIAPNGDVVGVEWDPYSADHLLNFKYEAFSGKWFYFDEQLHQPFYDREWVTVVPGPFSIDGQTVPYVSFLKGGYPSKEVWLYSTDGLHYLDPSSKFVDSTVNADTQAWLATRADPSFDWIQPNTNTGLTALGAGGALAAPDWPFGQWALLDGSSLSWTGFQFPGGTDPNGLYQVDSGGRIHDVVPNGKGTGFAYRISSNGGRSWRSVTIALPAKHTIDQIDFRANRAAGVAAVVVHALNSDTQRDQDYAYKLDITRDQPVLQRAYLVGLGDAGSAAGVGNSVRMDFQTVALLPDGRIAMSFLDSTTHYPSPTTGLEQQRPALAIELDTSLSR